MISHAFSSAFIPLLTDASSELPSCFTALPHLHFQNVTNPVQHMKQEALQQEYKETGPLAFYKLHREGLQNGHVGFCKQKSGKYHITLKPHKKSNCWYHSSKCHINTQPCWAPFSASEEASGPPTCCSLHLLHSSTLANGRGDVSLPPNTFRNAPSLSYTPTPTTGFHSSTRPGPTEVRVVPGSGTAVSQHAAWWLLKVWGEGKFCKVKTIFTMISGYFLPFSLSFPHEHTVEFSRGYKSAIKNHRDG